MFECDINESIEMSQYHSLSHPYRGGVNKQKYKYINEMRKSVIVMVTVELILYR